MSKLNLKKRTDAGFTLVELSLVLVIIAVLIAGVVTGGSLIKSAQLNGIISDFRNYQTAYNSFITKYGAVPGDFKDASSFWTDCVASGSTVSSCNGNGNGLVETGTSAEVVKAWRHLASAGMVNAGIEPISTATLTIQKNAPGSKIDGGGYFILGENLTIGALAANTPKVNPFYDGVANAVFIGGSTSAEVLQNGVLTPEEAYNLDKRIDDGVVVSSKFSGYDTGIVRTINGNNASSTNGDCVNSTVGYKVSNTLKVCVMGMALN